MTYLHSLKGIKSSASKSRSIREHLAELSSEMLYEYLHNRVLPMLVKEENGVEKIVRVMWIK